MEQTLAGRARVLGDDINTDYIISSGRKRETIDASTLSRYLLEAIDPAFAGSVRPGDLIVAGRNFGCGSAMEVAATVILAAGIPAVLARTFSRSFYRNAINNALIPIECDTSGILEGDEIVVEFGGAEGRVQNLRTGAVAAIAPLPDIMREILDAGGLVGYVRQRRKRAG